MAEGGAAVEGVGVAEPVGRNRQLDAGAAHHAENGWRFERTAPFARSEYRIIVAGPAAEFGQETRDRVRQLHGPRFRALAKDGDLGALAGALAWRQHRRHSSLTRTPEA